MFGKRYDGRVVHNIEPMQKIVPYLMKTRTDSMTMFEESIICDGMDEYIKRRAQEGKSIDYMQIWNATPTDLSTERCSIFQARAATPDYR